MLNEIYEIRSDERELFLLSSKYSVNCAKRTFFLNLLY